MCRNDFRRNQARFSFFPLPSPLLFYVLASFVRLRLCPFVPSPLTPFLASLHPCFLPSTLASTFHPRSLPFLLPSFIFFLPSLSFPSLCPSLVPSSRPPSYLTTSLSYRHLQIHIRRQQDRQRRYTCFGTPLPFLLSFHVKSDPDDS